MTVLADIRTVPRSRRNPQFDRDALREALRSRRIRYIHLPALGGLRHARPDSPNGGWRNASFCGYADYMLPDDFGGGAARHASAALRGAVRGVRERRSVSAGEPRCRRGRRGRLAERLGESIEYDGSSVRAFPVAGAIADARLSKLKGCGMSLRKAETLRNAARAIESGDITEEKLARMESREAILRLTELPGIGPWNATVILLRGMGRLDRRATSAWREGSASSGAAATAATGSGRGVASGSACA